MRRIALIATLLFAGHAGAQTLYKCLSRAGTSYQQTPCAPGARTMRTIETRPEPPPTPQQLHERDQKAKADRLESAYLSHQAGTDRSAAGTRRGRSVAGQSRKVRTADAGQCRSAMSRRERTLAALGLKRRFDDLRRLDEQVAAACRD